MGPNEDAFHVGSNGHLWVEGCDAVDLAERFGTPLYVVSEQQLRTNYRRLRDAWESDYPGEVKVLFANKALNNPSVRMILNQEGAGGDCFGYGELYLSLMAGTPPERLVVNGSNKTEPEIDLAVGAGVGVINIDALDEIDLIEAAAIRYERVQGVGIRVKLLLDEFAQGELKTVHGTGTIAALVQEHKWGMSWEDTKALVARAQASPHLALKEISFHLGRVSHDPEHWSGVARELVQWSVRLRDETGWEPESLDLGGGYPVGRPEGGGPGGEDGADTPTYEVMAKAVVSALLAACRANDLRVPTLTIEPGRAIAASTTILISRVGATKTWPGHGAWVNVDTSSNHVLHADSRHWYYHIVAVNKADAPCTETVDVVGPLCSIDVLGHQRKLPELVRGDLIALMDVGAYAETTSAQFNGQTRPATLLVSGSKAEIITERETLRDLIGRFRIPPRLLRGRAGGGGLPGVGLDALVAAEA